MGKKLARISEGWVYVTGRPIMSQDRRPSCIKHGRPYRFLPAFGDGDIRQHVLQWEVLLSSIGM